MGDFSEEVQFEATVRTATNNWTGITSPVAASMIEGYTLEVPVQYQNDAAAVANRRYRKCLRFVEERLATASPGAASHGGQEGGGDYA